MRKQFFPLHLSLLFLIFFAQTSCTKIDTTRLGAGLIPDVDNVHTFADTLTVIGTQGILSADTTKIGVSDVQVLGHISNDPDFGKTTANIYLQLKPPFFPYYFGNAKDSIGQPYAPVGTGFDSVVLCLSYQGFYGDTSKAQHLRVLQLDAMETNFRFDSIYNSTYQPATRPVIVLGETTIFPSSLSNYTYLKNRKDSVNYQIRIPLNTAFLQKILTNADSSAGKPFSNDSLFTGFLKGFMVEASGSQGANGLFYISLTDAKTRLEFHYRRKNITPVDTSYSAFSVVATTAALLHKSATANAIIRDRAGSGYANAAPNVLYIQSDPGTYAKLQIPGLSSFKNSIIHRAELMVEQIPGADGQLAAPNFLYLDIADSTTTFKYKAIPFDLNPNTSYDPNTNVVPFYPTTGIDFNYFGGNLLTKKDALTGKLQRYYHFNLSRYVQNIVTRGAANYTLRLSAPANLYYYGFIIPFNNRLAYGGIKIGNGNNANYKLRMRVVYSTL